MYTLSPYMFALVMDELIMHIKIRSLGVCFLSMLSRVKTEYLKCNFGNKVNRNDEGVRID